MSEVPRHLLVRLPNPLGDAVMATPALRGLRRALPDSRITWVGRRAALKALEGLDDRDDVAPLAGPFASGWLSPFRAGKAWRGLDPDAVLLLPHSVSSALAARVSGAPRRTGWGGRHRGVLLTEKVELARGEDGQLARRPMRAMYLDLAAPYGARDDGEGSRVVSTAFDRRRADRRLDGAEGLLAVNPGAAFGASKIYPPERLAQAVRRAATETGLEPLVLCGPGEEALAEETASHLRVPHRSTHDDPPDLGELKALLQRAAVLVTTDAGPRHLARALDVATVVVLGPTDPRWTEGDGAHLVRNETLDCLGCHLRTCPIAHPCMLELDPDVVADAVIRAVRSTEG